MLLLHSFMKCHIHLLSFVCTQSVKNSYSNWHEKNHEWEKKQCNGYINNQQSPFIGPIKMPKKCEQLPPLDYGYHEMKFTYFHCFSSSNILHIFTAFLCQCLHDRSLITELSKYDI